MKKFATELHGKTVMTEEGRILGKIDNFVIDTVTGDMKHVLVLPSDEIEPKLFEVDPQGRLVLPFQKMNAVRDVVVMNI